MLVVAIIIGISTFLITNNIAQKLAVEERKKVELWALGMRQLSALDNEDKDYTFILEVIKNNETVPVIVTLEVRSPSSLSAALNPGSTQEAVCIIL